MFIGHVMNIYNMTVIDEGIFATYSYDGTIRWWNTQAKSCFSFFNVTSILSSSKNISKQIKSYAWIYLNFPYRNKNMRNSTVKDVH